MTRSLSRRGLLFAGAASFALAACSNGGRKSAAVSDTSAEDAFEGSEWRTITDAEWKQRLSPEAYNVLRQEGTERAGSSPLDKEERNGLFHCAGCDLALFSSDMKFDSGTGWPSFFDVLPGAVGTKIDNKLFYARTEYHCARCGGHQGHIFEDGPAPTGLRYCNNGVALSFKPA